MYTVIKPHDGRMGCNYVVARIVGTGGIQEKILVKIVYLVMNSEGAKLDERTDQVIN